MCGLAGWIGEVENPNNVINKLLKSLHHRGPDSQGFKIFKNAALVHTRLKIIDLSSNADQPIANESNSIFTIFNGEIYNFQQLKIKLVSKGHIFKSQTDSEVIVHLYEEYGTNFIKLLKGMFAIALYDSLAHKLILTRDRFGIKPLFYATNQNFIYFASEINTLLKFPNLKQIINKQALADFVAFSYIPAPQTFYQNVFNLEPGTILIAKQGNDSVSIDFTIKKYISEKITPNYNLKFDEVVVKSEFLIKQSISQKIYSDVELGSLMSSGIDSSLISFYTQKLLSNKLNTFNVAFPDNQFDESSDSKKISDTIQSCHKILHINQKKIDWDELIDVIDMSGQPYANSSIIAFNKISKMTKKYVSTAFSGDGGDELFGGYYYFNSISKLAKVNKIPPYLINLITRLSPDKLSNKLSDVNSDLVKIIEPFFTWNNSQTTSKLIRFEHLPSHRWLVQKWQYNLSNSHNFIDRIDALVTENSIRTTLANDFLFKVDLASMHNGLEIRVPFLDEDLLDFSLTLPHHLKASMLKSKIILRQLAKKYLSSHVAKRPKKGFAIPLDVMLSQKLKIKIKDYLTSPSSRLSNYLDSDFFIPWISDFISLKSNSINLRLKNYQNVFILLSLERYLRKL